MGDPFVRTITLLRALFAVSTSPSWTMTKNVVIATPSTSPAKKKIPILIQSPYPTKKRDTARHFERFINSKPLGFVGLVRVLKRPHSPDVRECGYHVSINERIRLSYRGGTEEYRLLKIGEAARFVPGLGRGRRPIYRTTNLEDRPQRLDLADLAQHYCSTCNLTWLSGNDRPASRRCPTHGHAEGNTPRSILVYTDGACPGNGSPRARAGIGVSFHPPSRPNASKPMFPDLGTPTNQKAEFWAVVRALVIIRLNYAPVRIERVHQAGDTCSGRCQQTFGFRVIVATDSSYVVETMCSHLPKWTWDESDAMYYNKRGSPIANSVLVREVVKELYSLYRLGVDVLFCHVPRHENQHADHLARVGAKLMYSKLDVDRYHLCAFIMGVQDELWSQTNDS